jgi:hypothetical protein
MVFGVTVKVTVPILTAPALLTRWKPILRPPTNFAHFLLNKFLGAKKMATVV